MRSRDTKSQSQTNPANGWFVYMLECAEDRIYTGIAVDVAARFQKHCNGTGAAFTRINKPLRVMAVMPCTNRSEASKTESRLKKLRRPAKLVWAAQWPWTSPRRS
jgi:putative endonuclease